jgi:hypothetical protein
MFDLSAMSRADSALRCLRSEPARLSDDAVRFAGRPAPTTQPEAAARCPHLRALATEEARA